MKLTPRTDILDLTIGWNLVFLTELNIALPILNDVERQPNVYHLLNQKLYGDCTNLDKLYELILNTFKNQAYICIYWFTFESALN